MSSRQGESVGKTQHVSEDTDPGPDISDSQVVGRIGPLAPESSGSAPFRFLPLQGGDTSVIPGGEFSESSYGGLSTEGDFSTKIQPPQGHKRSPVRGMLRAVSSLTITDVELFEESILQIRDKKDQPISTKRHKSPTIDASIDLSPTFPTSSHSASRKATLRPKRVVGNGRRMRSKSQGEETDDDDLNGIPVSPPFSRDAEQDGALYHPRHSTIDLVLTRESADAPQYPRRKMIDYTPESEKGGPQQHHRRKSFDLVRAQEIEDKTQHSQRKAIDGNPNGEQGFSNHRPRGKSVDLLPNLPRRTTSRTALDETSTRHKVKQPKVSAVDRLMGDLNIKGTSKSTKRQSSYAMFLGTRRTFVDGQVDGHARPSDQAEASAPGLQLFDRFKSDNTLVAHENGLGPNEEGITLPRNDEAISNLSYHDTDASPYVVREFVVSLDDLEDQRLRSGKPQRRQSYDSLPTPPKRFLEELAGSETDSDDELGGRRRSFDDIWRMSQQFLTTFPEYTQKLNDFGDRGQVNVNLDRSCRSNSSHESSRSKSHSNALDRSSRSGGNSRRSRRRSTGKVSAAEIPFDLDRSCSRSHHSHDRSYGRSPVADRGLHNLDFSIRSQSTDCLPALPRRHSIASDAGIDEDDVVPLNDNKRVNAGAADPVVHVFSKVPMSDFHADVGTVSSKKGRGHRFPDLNSSETNDELLKNDEFVDDGDEVLIPLRRGSDTLPPLPIRERSDPSLNIHNFSSSEDEHDKGYVSSDDDDTGSGSISDFTPTEVNRSRSIVNSVDGDAESTDTN